MESESLLPTRFFLLIFAFLAALSRCINADILKSKEYEHDGVITLPGQQTVPKISQFSGNITDNKAHGMAPFDWIFEAQAEPRKKPLLFWVNGGPGSSFIRYGAAVELGPLRAGENGESTFLKPPYHHGARRG